MSSAPLVARNPPLEPSALGVVYREQAGKLEPLEMQRAPHEELSRVAPIARSYLAVAGAASPLRYHGQDKLRFLVRFRWMQGDLPWPAYQLDPSQFRLYSLRPEGERRLLVLSETTPIRSVSYPGLPLRVTPWGQDSLALEVTSPLQPGEYAIRYGKDLESCDLFCFGLEGSPSP